jgi:hydrogenase nickel incorporation protein HypA/HybF
MHGLPVIKSILDVCLKHAIANDVLKIRSIKLKIGELSDLEAIWMQRYFDWVIKDTNAEGAKLKIEKTPVIWRCERCSDTFSVNIREIKELYCPRCENKECTLIPGREYIIEKMEVM